MKKTKLITVVVLALLVTSCGQSTQEVVVVQDTITVDSVVVDTTAVLLDSIDGDVAVVDSL